MSLVQVISKNLTASGTTQTTAAIGTTQGNDLVFFAVYNAANAGVVTPSDSTSQAWTPVAGSPFAGTATGLVLAAWVAKNIPGNAANTFTFATTGNDTPTVFVAEFSGRDRINPIDLTVTASDATSSSGAHTTGSISPLTRNDDLIVLNVAGTVGQSFTASGGWSIPPNGTITSSPGYDSFVQYQNNVGLGAVSNTYSVGNSDKLDAFIIALKVPQQPYSDEWLDAFNEVPEVYSVGGSYIQLDVQPQIADVDTDWSEDSGENDAWTGVEAQSGIIIPNVATNSATQYYGEDAELADEALDPVAFAGGYQTIDATSFFDDPSDWDEDPDDFFADDFGNDDADPPAADAWDWNVTDDDDYVVIDDFINLNLQAPSPITVEDAWDPQFFGEEPDQPDGTANDLDAVGPNNNPVIGLEDPFDPLFDDVLFAEDDSWWITVAGDYPLIDVATVGTITIEDAWDHFAQDPDDEAYYVLDSDPIPPNTAQLAEDPWDWFVTDDDDYAVSEDYAQPPDILQSAVTTFDWDWTQDSDDEEWAFRDLDPVTVPQAPCPDDAWDWTQDADEEHFFVLDADQIPVPVPQLVEDPWDWTQDADDENFFVLDSDKAGPDAIAPFDDAWDWSQDDVDDLAGFFYNDQAIPSVVVNSAAQYYGEDAEYADEAIEPVEAWWVDQEILGTSQVSTGRIHSLILTQNQYRLLTTPVPKVQMLTGPEPYQEFYGRVGDRKIFGIDWSQWLANPWIAGESIATSFVIRPTIPNGFQYICSTAGESAENEPAWPAVVGATVSDGSVVWTCEAIDTTSLSTTVSSALWTATAGILVVGPSVAGQITTALLDATGAVAGTDYVVNCAATFADGEVATGQIKLKVR